MKKSLFIFPILFICIAVFIPMVISADTYGIVNPTEWDTFAELVDAVAEFMEDLAIPLGGIMFIISGFYFVTSMGDPDKIKRAKDIALWTAIGLLIVFSASAIIGVIKDLLGTPVTGG